MIVSDLFLYPLEIFIGPHVGHGGECFCKTFRFWPQQYLFEQGAMFGLGTPAVPRRTLFERIDDALIEVSDHKICHNDTVSVSATE